MTKSNVIIIRKLGRQDYLPTFDAMRKFSQSRDDKSSDEFWLVEHPPVYTQGRNSKPEHLLNSGSINVVDIDRGGQVTYHGPGQLVLYVMLDLTRMGKGVRYLVSAMEQSIINLLTSYSVSATARADAPGVYVNGAKVAALGLRISRGRSYHGLSLNVDMDLTPYQGINPCGHAGMIVTQCRDLGIKDSLATISNQLCILLSKELGYNAHVYEPSRPDGLAISE